ncbi:MULTISPECIES: mandelate racemase/muconate lactonizing enzyme family protein [unclassified Delftia]|uniref:mandelate racemase/muconate lactonizing enzyme family protein n=1 Tax=unclassified Delftia TaxID=2613839 RepID=UPI0019013213|nr:MULTISPECIES: mandelate racemase/muconate lactonizing enzyme family protein [unclassified Delftia]MBK0114072.1 mandelate racemase/muconate lactonizing enzyme family protein [Delftia sp. S65]MBK0117880.1 mandelate racemase/muconate lactonizing enzyme family protein [Delftia sp. S67]MBK0129121.1 mandelate racemase/muconate lactonizing enzyme family protein [Delftia sp. S66]
MKITRIEVLEAELSGQCGIASWHHVFVRVHTDEGISGLGEVGMAYGTGAPAAGPMVLALGERFVLGHNPFSTESIWERMLRKSFWAEGGGPVVFGAMSAIDSALWDIKGRALNQPVHRVLGADTPAPLRCYASQLQFDWTTDKVSNLVDASRYLEAAQRAREEGYDCVKVDPLMIAPDGTRAAKLRGILTPAERRLVRKRMEAIRTGIGADADIILELHSFTSMGGALQLADELKDLGILFMEEPTHYNGMNAHNRVAAKSPVPIAAGERLYTRWGFLPYLVAGSMDMIQPDVGLVGGISEAVKIAHLAHAHDVGVQAHVCGSPLATAMALQFEAAIPNFEIHEHHTYALKPCNRDLFVEDLQPVSGRFEVPTTPGLGMTLRPEAEAKMAKRAVVLKS